MSTNHKRQEREGWSVLEATTATLFVALLTGITLPGFFKMQYMAERAEVPTYVTAIQAAEIAYQAANGVFITVRKHPDRSADSTPRDWQNGNTDYQMLGWSPIGKVRGRYSVSTTQTSTSTPGGDFTVRGDCDVDDNNADATYTATKSIDTVFLNVNDTY